MEEDLHDKLESSHEVMTCSLWGSFLKMTNMLLILPKARKAVWLLLSQVVQSCPPKELMGPWGGEELLAMKPKWFKYKEKKRCTFSYNENFRGFMDLGVAGLRFNEFNKDPR